MSKNLYCKILAVGIIVLFIGAGIHPSFAVDTKTSIISEDWKEKEVTIPRNRVSYGSCWLSFIDMFPILQKILNYIL